jgi:probable O-glycosylation ligase (exosortase A-associated)
MPESWFERMESIRDFGTDSSATGRINAWKFAIRLAANRLVGGGFDVFTPHWFRVYAPDPTRSNDAHSIYFEVLGEHGIVGLVLFLGVGALAWRSCTWMARRADDDEETLWISDLARMCQVAIVGYAAFVGLAYFDLYYNIIAIIVIAKLLLAEQLTEHSERDVSRPGVDWRRRVSPAVR